MQSKISFRSVLIISIVGVAVSLFFLTLNMTFQTSNHSRSTDLPPLSSPINKVSIELPTRLKIPQIGIDASIGSVGLTAKGMMDVPAGPDDTAWLDLGPRPGEIGSAVIDGHAGWKDNIPAVFDNLYKLNIGDKIFIEDASGMTLTFVVRKIRTYTSTADVSAVFASNDTKAHLNLITCAGAWNEATKSSSKRLVVFADRDM